MPSPRGRRGPARPDHGSWPAGCSAHAGNQGPSEGRRVQRTLGGRHPFLFGDGHCRRLRRGKSPDQSGELPQGPRGGTAAVRPLPGGMQALRDSHPDRPEPRVAGVLYRGTVWKYPSGDGPRCHGVGRYVPGGGILRGGRVPEGQQYGGDDRSLPGTGPDDAGARGCLPAPRGGHGSRQRRFRPHQVLCGHFHPPGRRHRQYGPRILDGRPGKRDSSTWPHGTPALRHRL